MCVLVCVLVCVSSRLAVNLHKAWILLSSALNARSQIKLEKGSVGKGCERERG